MRFVKSEKPVATKHAKLGDISVEVEVPQYDSLEEFAQACGSADAALEYVNSSVETSAKNGGRAALRNLPETANLDEAKTKIQSIVRDYAPQAGDRQPGKAKKAAAFDSVKELVESGKEFTREELLALLAAAK